MMNIIKVLLPAFLLALALPAYAAEDDGDKQAFMSPNTYKKIEDINENIEKEEFQEALERLRELEEDTKDNDYEQAVTMQMYGYVYINLEQYENALTYLERALKLNALPKEPERQVIYLTAQIYSSLEQYQKTIDLMTDWFKTAEDPPADAYLITANAYAALERWQPAYPYIKKAVEKSDKKIESWWQLKVTVEFELGKFPEAAQSLEVLVANWPDKKKYWRMLAGVYMELTNESKALATLASGYKQGVITEESDLLNLARLYMMKDVPYQAGKLLEAEIATGNIEKTKKNYELLSSAWIQAKEYVEGIEALGKAADLSEDGKLYLRQAQLFMNVIDYKGAREAAKNALDKGGLKDKEKGQAWLIRGSASAELKQFADAETAFNKARGYQETRRVATSWLEFIRTEQSVSALN